MRNSTLIAREQARHRATARVSCEMGDLGIVDLDITHTLPYQVCERIDQSENPIDHLREMAEDRPILAVTVRKGGSFILQGEDLHFYGTWARFLRLLHAGGWNIRTGSYRALTDNLLAVVERATELTEFLPPDELVERHESPSTDGGSVVYWEDRADGPDSLNWVDLPLPPEAVE